MLSIKAMTEVDLERLLLKISVELMIFIMGLCPFGSAKLIGSPKQYEYEFNPPFPNGLKLSGLLKRINTGLKAR
ncbi:hypothetical protein D3C72_1854930 [compost metagenome]